MVTSRISFTAAQKAELWERWKNGQSAAAISAKALEQRKQKAALRESSFALRGLARAPTEGPAVPAQASGDAEDLPWHCGGPVDPADRPALDGSAIDSKPGDQAQRRQSAGLSCKPG